MSVVVPAVCVPAVWLDTEEVLRLVYAPLYGLLAADALAPAAGPKP